MLYCKNCLKCNNDGNRQDSWLAYAPCDCYQQNIWICIGLGRDWTVDRILLVGQSLHVVANDGRCLQVYKFKNYNIFCLFITNQLLGQLVGAIQMAIAHSQNPCETPKSISFTSVYRHPSNSNITVSYERATLVSCRLCTLARTGFSCTALLAANVTYKENFFFIIFI